MRLIAASILALAMSATPALAQDVATDPSGVKVFALGGLDHLKDSTDKATGIGYLASVGYDFSLNGVLGGVEAEVGDSTTKDCFAVGLVANDRACVRTGRDLYAGGRIGFAAGRATVYVKGGYTNARITADYRGGAIFTKDGDNLDGVRVGGGVEIGDKVLGRLEYRYSNYEQDVSRHQVLLGVGYKF